MNHPLTESQALAHEIERLAAQLPYMAPTSASYKRTSAALAILRGRHAEMSEREHSVGSEPSSAAMVSRAPSTSTGASRSGAIEGSRNPHYITSF